MDEKEPEPTTPIGESHSEVEGQEEQPPEFIRLDHFLQLCGVQTGGQAKQLIQAGEVKLNGEVETRRRKKLVPGDVVAIYDEEFEVSLSGDE